MSQVSSPDSANQSGSRKDAGKDCNHSKVRVVARDGDAEFVECEDCRAVFEASEFEDMEIEERNLPADS